VSGAAAAEFVAALPSPLTWFPAPAVRLNDVGHANGLVQVDIDNALKIHYHKLRWRNRADVDIDAFVFSTWFGGSDGSWAPPRTVDSYFRNIKMYRL
jgi:hypothetical protein